MSNTFVNGVSPSRRATTNPLVFSEPPFFASPSGTEARSCLESSLPRTECHAVHGESGSFMSAIPLPRRWWIKRTEVNRTFKPLIAAAWVSAIAVTLLFSPPAEAADAAAGKKLFRQCGACHALDGKNRVGPHLDGIVDRPVASAEGFKYSKAMVAFGEGAKVWDEQRLAEFLASPRTAVKGTTMVFTGLKKPEDIANVITFLKEPEAAK